MLSVVHRMPLSPEGGLLKLHDLVPSIWALHAIADCRCVWHPLSLSQVV
jgi:hypothetical protein